MADSSLVIKITAEAAQFEKKIDDIKGKSAALEDQLSSVAKVSGIAFAALAAAGGIALKAFGESEKASNELTLALQNQGIASKKLTDDYNRLAKSIQDKTGVDDDAIKSGFAVLQGFIGQQEISEELANSLVNLAEKTGSVESAAEILGRGIQGNVKGLKAYGLAIDDSLSKEERLAAITEQVSQKFGGLAEANNKGVNATRGLTTAFGNFLEGVGQRLAPTFEKIVIIATKFFQVLSENGPLLDFIVEIGKIVGIIAGFVTAAAAAAIAIVKIRDALLIADAGMKILGLSTRALVGATGIGLLLIVAYEIYENWNKIFPAMQAVFNAFANNIGNVGKGLGQILFGIFNPSAGGLTAIKAGYETLKNAALQGVGEVRDAMGKEKPVEGLTILQDPDKLEAANQASAEAARKESARIATLKAERQAAALEAQDASAAQIELKKQEVEILKKLEDEKFKGQRALLEEQLISTRLLQQQALADEAETRRTFQEEALAESEAYQALSAEQKRLFLEKNQKALTDTLLSENQAQQKAAADQLKQRIDANNKYLIEQARYGTAFATINAAVNSTQVQGFQQATGQLSQLQNSRNATLKAVGKGAAIADITIKTAQAAMAAYQGFLQAIPFPPVAIPLGLAAAGAVVLYGAEQISNVVSAQSGGVIPGLNRGGDSVPSFLQPGELVVPRSSFDEVVGAVADRRANEAPQTTAGVANATGAGQQIGVSLSFSGDGAEKFLTARRVEARSLGTLREAPVA